MSFLTPRIYLAVGAVAVGGYFLLPDFAQNLGYVLIGASVVVALRGKPVCQPGASRRLTYTEADRSSTCLLLPGEY